jgi:hypothetical protein
MALRDQNPKNLAFASKVDWSVAWIEILKGQVWGIIENGGGGSTSQVNSDWDATSGVAEILNKPNLTIYEEKADKGVASGYASLDGAGLVPLSQLPLSTALVNKGAWNAATNTPTLIDGVGTNGDFYVVSVGATRDLGSGNIIFVAGNGVLYNGTIWQQIGSVMAATVTNVTSTDTDLLTVDLGTSTPELTVIAAPKLATPRDINNIEFDGTTDILLNSTYNNQSGTTYTFVLADNQKIVTATNVAAQTYTVPPNSSVAFPVGTRIDIIQEGAGKVTIAQGSGVTINSQNGNKAIAGQYVGVTLLKRGTNTWTLIGNLIA